MIHLTEIYRNKNWVYAFIDTQKDFKTKYIGVFKMEDRAFPENRLADKLTFFVRGTYYEKDFFIVRVLTSHQDRYVTEFVDGITVYNP